MLQRLVGHDRAEVRASNTDVDNVANALTSVAFPAAAANAVAEGGHLVEDGMDCGNDVFAVHNDRFALGRAQGHMQHGPLLSDIYLVPAEHGVYPSPETRFLG